MNTYVTEIQDILDPGTTAAAYRRAVPEHRTWKVEHLAVSGEVAGAGYTTLVLIGEGAARSATPGDRYRRAHAWLWEVTGGYSKLIQNQGMYTAETNPGKYEYWLRQRLAKLRRLSAIIRQSEIPRSEFE